MSEIRGDVLLLASTLLHEGRVSVRRPPATVLNNCANVVKPDLPSPRYPSSRGNRQPSALISAPPVFSLAILTSYVLAGLPPASKWASGIVEPAGRDEGRVIVRPSNLFGGSYMARSPRSPGERQGISQTTLGWQEGRNEAARLSVFAPPKAQDSRFARRCPN